MDILFAVLGWIVIACMIFIIIGSLISLWHEYLSKRAKTNYLIEEHYRRVELLKAEMEKDNQNA